MTGNINVTGLEPGWQEYALPLNHYDMKILCTGLVKNQKPQQQCSHKSENLCDMFNLFHDFPQIYHNFSYPCSL